MPSAAATPEASQAYDQELWKWDVFICHAEKDKAFALSLRDQLLPLRVLLYEDSLCFDGRTALQQVEAAVRSTFIAVVLLCEEVFQEGGPLQELRWFLEGCRLGMNKLIPVFLGITGERCEELAREVGLAWALNSAALQHVVEGPKISGKGLRRDETFQHVVKSVRDLMGAKSFSPQARTSCSCVCTTYQSYLKSM